MPCYFPCFLRGCRIFRKLYGWASGRQPAASSPVAGSFPHETIRRQFPYTLTSYPGPDPMNIAEAMRIALQSLWANKLRSVLTLLGVVIGVSSVIAVVTFVNGINGYVAEKVFNLGADVFIV